MSDTSPDTAPTDTATHTVIDLDAIENDLDGVEAALARLADDTYWTDEVTGRPLDTEFLEANPMARRAPASNESEG